MRFRLYTLVTLAVVLCCSMGHAEIHKVTFNVFTHHDINSATPESLRFFVEIFDTQGLRPPDAVDWTAPFTITIPTSPKPTKYHVQMSDWEEWSDMFGPMINPDSIGGTIPTGNYVLTLTDKAGRTFTSTNTLTSNAFLPAVTITQTPTAKSPNTLKWTKVSGAQYYRIRLKDEDWREPVYWYPKNKDVYIPTGTSPSFTFPAGVIRAGHHYMVQIEARDNDKDLSKRSRSLWVGFVGP